jgi:hypothetical protein
VTQCYILSFLSAEPVCWLCIVLFSFVPIQKLAPSVFSSFGTSTFQGDDLAKQGNKPIVDLCASGVFAPFNLAVSGQIILEA